MRLIEALNLGEEESVRFFAKQNLHDNKIHELMELRRSALDNVEKLLTDKADVKETQKAIDKILEIDQEIFTERKNYQESLRQTLTTEQFAKYLIFEHNFDRQLRDAMREMRRGRPQQEEE
jgi:hypothetical protein